MQAESEFTVKNKYSGRLNRSYKHRGSGILGRLHTNRLFAGVEPAPVVEFFARTGITAAGGQFDFERCTRKIFVHRNRRRNLLVLLYLRRKYKETRKTILDTPNFSSKIFGRKLLHAL